jgi:hypothetical protein
MAAIGTSLAVGDDALAPSDPVTYLRVAAYYRAVAQDPEQKMGVIRLPTLISPNGDHLFAYCDHHF